MKEWHRVLRSGTNRKTISIMGTKTLDDRLRVKAEEYGMNKSEFIRALLENIDEDNLYGAILGDK